MNTRSSTEVELIRADDMVSKIIWLSKFLISQGLSQRTTLFQDNVSAILLETKGTSSAGERMTHLDGKYFFLKNLVACGELDIQWCPTTEMVADFLTKPLQGKLFFEHRRRLLGPQ